jgi:hypothetical protein
MKIKIGVYFDPMGDGLAERSPPKTEFEYLVEEAKDLLPKHIKPVFKEFGGIQDAFQESIDVMLIDYGGMNIGMSGFCQSNTRAVEKLLEDKPSLIVWLLSTMTKCGYEDFISNDSDVIHERVMYGDYSEEKSWKKMVDKIIL